MAGFKTHVTVSSLAGVGYGAGAFLLFDVPPPTCLLAGGLCGVSGMLPDIDSGPGRPLRESMAFAAAIVPMMVAERLRILNVSTELIVLYGAILYFLIRFGVAWLLRKYTVHRGMFHSIPAAVIAAEVAFLLASGETEMRIYKAGAVFIGYMSHLVLDEFYSVKVSARGVRIKSSLGTAVKIFGRKWIPNISTYGKLALLTTLVVQEPGWMLEYQERQRNLHEQTITRAVLKREGLVPVPEGSWAAGNAHEFETDELMDDVGKKTEEAKETIGSLFKKWR